MRPLNQTAERRLMIVAILLYWISLYLYVYLLGSYGASLGASHSMVGMITGAYGFMMMLCRIPLGVLSDALHNRKVFMCIGMGLCLVAGLGLFFSQTPAMLMVFNGIAGVAVSSWAIFISSYCAYFPKNQSVRIIGDLNVMMSGGQLIGTLCGGIAAQVFGLRQVFLFAAAAAIAGGICLLPVRDTYRSGTASKGLNDYLHVAVGDRRLLFYSFLAAAINFINVAAINSFVPLILINLGANSFQISLGSTLCVLSGVIAAPLSCTILKTRLGIRKTTVLGFFMISIPMFLFTRADSIPYVLFLESISGFGRNMMFPLFTACATAHLSEDMYSTGLSTFQAIYAAGMFCGPVMTGVLSEWFFPMETTFHLLAICCILISVYAIFAKQLEEI